MEYPTICWRLMQWADECFERYLRSKAIGWYYASQWLDRTALAVYSCVRAFRNGRQP